MSHFIVNAAPKSASMYAWHLLEEVFGLNSIGIGLRQRKFILDEQILQTLAHQPADTISHNHLRLHSFHRDFIREYALQGVVMVRPLVETTVSLAEFFAQQSHIAFFDESDFVRRKFQSPETPMPARYDFIIRYCMPWYLAFMQEWQEAAAPHFMKVDYAYVTQRPKEFLAAFGRRFGRTPVLEPKAIDQAIARKHNFNSGNKERWRRALAERQVEELVKLARFYELEAFVFDTSTFRDAPAPAPAGPTPQARSAG
jgi:hypothetical protein